MGIGHIVLLVRLPRRRKDGRELLIFFAATKRIPSVSSDQFSAVQYVALGDLCDVRHLVTLVRTSRDVMARDLVIRDARSSVRLPFILRPLDPPLNLVDFLLEIVLSNVLQTIRSILRVVGWMVHCASLLRKVLELAWQCRSSRKESDASGVTVTATLTLR